MSRRMDTYQTHHPDESQSSSRQRKTDLSMGPQLTSRRQETDFDSRYPPHALKDAPSEEGSAKESESAADMEQHCLLFPTYATQHSRSGSKDPLDWNIRVRGWAFSKRSNRRKRLVMSMARKLAGVTKDDNKVYETLESRFGMFLASNTQGAWFSIQCIGAVSTTHMELAGDPSSHDPTVDILRDEFKSPDAAIIAADAADDRAKVRRSLEETGNGVYAGLHNIQPHDSPSGNSEPFAGRDTPPAQISPPNEDSMGFSPGRWSKGAALVVGAYRKYKPVVMAQVNSGSSALQTLHRYDRNRRDNTADTDLAKDRDIPTQNPHSTCRSDSINSVFSQSETHYEDLGCGLFPTVQISSRPGGHFDGTLRISRENVKAHRKQLNTRMNEEDGHHPRFLKLIAHHAEMTEPCHGIVNLIDPIGVSVISDIDDTIKETNIAAGARTILQNTFLKEMQDVPGMSQIYKGWWKQGAAIHYVSNSPWQLIPSLLEFFHSYKFPPGSAHLRLHDSVLKTYFMTPGESKRRAIHEILTDFPERRFILVGDSGEIDMEIYADVALEFPRQVFKIFIRDITSARLRDVISNTDSVSQSSRSLTSLIPTSLNYFVKQGNASSSTVDILNHRDSDESHQPADDVAKSGKAPSGYSSDRTSQYRGGSKEEGSVYSSTKLDSVEPVRRRSRSFSSDSPTMSHTAFSSTKTTAVDLDDDSTSETFSETNPGGPTPPSSTQPPLTAKSPLEIWQDRVEQCQKRLPEGLLTFFTEADTLGNCSVVNDMLQLYDGGDEGSAD